MTPNRKQRICAAIDDLLSDGQKLLAALGPDIWHGQTMLYNEQATSGSAAFVMRFRAVADQLGGDALQWKRVFSTNGGHFDVNLMRQALGVLQGFKSSVEQGLMEPPERESEMDHGESVVERLGALISEGRSIHAAIVVIPGEWVENWATKVARQTPTRYQLDWPRFSKWRTDASTLLDRLIPGDHSLRHLVDEIGSIKDQKSSLEWGIAQLESVQDSCLRGLLEAPSATHAPFQRVMLLLSRFHTVAKQLEHRHSGRATLKITDEYDVQDLLRSLLWLEFDDVREEEHTPSKAGQSARMDLILKREKIVVEVKMTRVGLTEKEVGNQLILDIARYQEHQSCELLVFFIYDPDGRIRNRTGLAEDLGKLGNPRLKVVVHVAP